MSKVIILYENEDWIGATTAALEKTDVPYSLWHLMDGHYDTASVPEEAVYFSKMSASAYTRGNSAAATHAAAIFSWLEQHERRIINGSGALKMEISKWHQANCLQAAGIHTPRSIAAFSKADVLHACDVLTPPYMLKPNCGGKGLGVQRFENKASLTSYLESDAYSHPEDGIWLLQETIQSATPTITRMEFVGGTFLYAVQVHTGGGFELCPAEACNIEEMKAASSCTLDATPDMFTILPDFEHPLIAQCEAFLQQHGVQVAGVECMEDVNGSCYVYDINTNTNYNPEAEAKAGVSGLSSLATYLKTQLAAL